MKIGSKIKRIREIKNITQKELASKIEMSISGYNKIERNEVDVNNEKLNQIAKALHVTPNEILSFDDKNVYINNQNNTNSFQFVVFDPDIKKLYEDKLTLQQEKINQLQKELDNKNKNSNNSLHE